MRFDIKGSATLPVRHPRTAIALVLVLAAIAGWFARRVEFDFSPQAFLAGRNDLVERSEHAKATFGYEDATIMLLLEATGDADVLAAPALNWQNAVAEQLEAAPRIEHVDAVVWTRAPRLHLGFPPTMEFARVVAAFPAAADDEARLRRTMRRSRLSVDTLLSADNRVTALSVAVDAGARHIADMQEVVEQIEGILARTPAPPGYRTHLAGLPALRVDTVRNLQEDQAFLLPLAGALYVVALAITFRRATGVIIPLGAVGMGLLWSLGWMGATHQAFNILSNVLPILMVIIGVSNCVHVLSHYAVELGAAAGDRPRAALATMAHMSVACLLTFTTTAIGFISLGTADSALLRAFGVQAATASLFLYLAIILVVGSLLARFRPPRSLRAQASRPDVLLKFAEALGVRSMQRPVLVVVATTVICGAAAWAGSSIRVNSYSLETYDPDHPTRRTLQLLEHKLGGLLPLEIVLTADDQLRFLEPEVYRAVAEFERFALEQPGIVFARSYVDMLQEMDAANRGEGEAAEDLPPENGEGRRRIERADRFMSRVEDELRYEQFMTDDRRQARILLRLQDIGTARTLEVSKTLSADLARRFPPESGVRAVMTGDAYVNAVSITRLIRDLASSLASASLMIFLIIAILFRSLRVGIVAMLPNLTPLAMTLFYMHLRGFEMNVSNVIVFTISVGIAVDDTIHFLFRFFHERSRHETTREAVIASLHQTGRATLLTTLLIVAGLSVLLFSTFVPTRRFAELTSVTMATAVFGDLVLLPAILVLVWRDKPRAARGLSSDSAHPTNTDAQRPV